MALAMDKWEQNEQDADTRDSFPSYPMPTMQNAAHPVATKVPPSYDGATSSTSWLKSSDAAEEWCDGQSVFLYRFFQMLRCSRGQTDLQRWIARQKAVDAWLDHTTPRPDPAGAQVVVEAQRLRETAKDRLRAEARQTYVGGAPADLEAHVNAIGLPDATVAMNEAAVETVWRGARRARSGLFPTSDNLAALMALVMADLSESQRETLMNLILKRRVDLTALTVDQLREFLITLFHAPKTSLENPSWMRKTGSGSFIATSHGELDEYEAHCVQDANNGEEGFLDEHEDVF